ncbi:hypothetical protein KAR91_24205 [Candidatus Pacearchaeota archaeon]|nr:hypothetical protein [Candidatus Pacearchaeota archaeon]
MKYEVRMTDLSDGYEPREKLEIYHNDECIQTEYDGGEPEDNSFCRDWNWVQFALQEAYDLGVEDGKSTNNGE